MLEQCHDLLRMISELEVKIFLLNLSELDITRFFSSLSLIIIKFWMQADAGEELKVLPYDSTQKDFVYKTCSRLGPWFPLLLSRFLRLFCISKS